MGGGVFMITIEMIISGIVSKMENDFIDISRDGIKRADNYRESKNQNFQTRMYQVIIDAINRFTFDKYKDQDVIYRTAENLLKGFKRKDSIIGVVKSSLKDIRYTSEEDWRVFLDILCDEIAQEKNTDIYRVIDLRSNIQCSENDYVIIEKLDQIDKKVSDESIHKKDTQKVIKNRTQEYADKWNSNMFLNNFDKRDENAGINVKLSEVYIDAHLPHYIWKSNNKPLTDLKELLAEYIGKNNEKQMLLILGQPGIGKSTLITWITANLISHNDDVLVYQFSSDLGNIDERYKKNGGFLDNILMSLDLTFGALEGKTLILDGFDEIGVGSDRVEILNHLYRELIEIRPTVNFKLIITCRENYIQQVSRIKCNYITLQPWEEDQIRSFCNKYGERIKNHISIETIGSILKSKEILGIPLILYMVLALDIKLEEDGSIVDVYDQIFSLEDGGIYDRCIKNINYGGPHRIKVIKEQIHLISEKIALWMFENEPDKAFIPKKEYERICDDITQKYTQNNYDIKNDFLIGNYFRLVKHCEGLETEELYFAHRTIYEYFVAEYIYVSITNVIIPSCSVERLAGIFGKILKGNFLNKRIIDFLKIKINNSELTYAFGIVNKTFRVMLRDGMTFYTKENYRNVIVCEKKVFANMLEIMHLWEDHYLKFDIVSYINIINVNNYSLNLKRVDLSGFNLSDSDLSYADLSHAFLIDSNLNRANLDEANLSGADLSRANLKGTSLNGANLNGANLDGANLVGANLNRVVFINVSFYKTIFDENNITFVIEKVSVDNLLKVRIITKEKQLQVSIMDYLEIFAPNRIRIWKESKGIIECVKKSL